MGKTMEGYRKFGLAGMLVAAAVYEQAWEPALIALAIYTVANVVERFQTR
jgi:hypothetical protein